jgi:ADP-ribosyl-[dinitrogen reductase] hydrolase
MSDLQGRYIGCLLGLSKGDALGTTLEFKPPGTFTPIDDMVGGGPFQLKPGQWTDDTSMALCLAESLIECCEMDAKDQMDRYLRWWKDGYLSSTGSCFDIGITVRNALAHYQHMGEPLAGSTDPQTAGNGSIMRLAPVPLFFAANPEDAIYQAGESSKTTHGTAEAVDGCRLLAALIVGAVQARTKEELCAPMFCPVSGLWSREPLSPKIAAIASGSYKDKSPPAIRGTGYVVESLEAALWAFYNSTSFKEGALLAVNLGDDADTTGAVYGQLAGAYYGTEGIPEEWKEVVASRSQIEETAMQLLHPGDRLAPEEIVPNVPFDRSYWVEPGRLLAGYYPGDVTKKDAQEKLDALVDAGIRCFINLTEEDEKSTAGSLVRSYQQLLFERAAAHNVKVNYLRIPIRDLGIPSEQNLIHILNTIDWSIEHDMPVYVHCRGGIGRTGTVVGCYLARHGIATGAAVMGHIADLRRREAWADVESPEAQEQKTLVCAWKRGR